MKRGLFLFTLGLVAAASAAHAQGSSVDAVVKNFNFALAFPDPSKPQEPFIGVVDGTGMTTASGELQGSQPAGPTTQTIGTLLPLVDLSGASALGSYALHTVSMGYDTQLNAQGGRRRWRLSLQPAMSWSRAGLLRPTAWTLTSRPNLPRCAMARAITSK